MSLSFLDRVLPRDPSIGLLALRVPVGLTFAAHGAQKLFGWFGGYGLDGTAKFFESIGLAPGVLLTLLAGGAEFVGGLALVLGLLLRPASAVLAFTMVVAIFSVHWSKGFFITAGGYEYALTLFVVSVALLLTGAGRYSIDALLSRGRRGATGVAGYAAAGSR